MLRIQNAFYLSIESGLAKEQLPVLLMLNVADIRSYGHTVKYSHISITNKPYKPIGKNCKIMSKVVVLWT